jgi:hypothetical protein
MACDGRQRGFPCMLTTAIRPSLPLAAVNVVTIFLCALSATAQPQPQPLPQQPNNLPLPAAACPAPQATLLPCISYFLGNSSSSPAAACCSQIQAAFESQAPCLCAAMAAAPSQLGLAVGAAQALLLPSACNLPPNACSAAGSSSGPSSTTTTTAVAAAPAPAAATGADDPAVAGGGLKSVPGLVDSAAAASGYRGLSAAAVLVSFIVAYVF